MFEIYSVGDGFRWRFISAAGATLYESPDTYSNDFAAAKAADEARTACWENAKRVERFPASY